MSSVVEQVRAGDRAAVAAGLAGLTPPQRRALLPELKRLYTELAASSHSRAGAWACLMVAGAVCHSAPSGAATWLARGEFEDVTAWQGRHLQELLDAQPVEWRAEVAGRLAERRPPRWGDDARFALTEHLVRSSGRPVPTAEGFVLGWARDRSQDPDRFRRSSHKLPPFDLHARLAADPFTPVLAPLMFETPGAEGELTGPWAVQDEDRKWPAVLARLTADGVLDRADLLDRVLARLVRGGRPGELRAVQAVLAALAPTAAENTARMRSYLALLDAPSAVAGHAQAVLIGLDAVDVLGEASQVLLFRPEKKLVRAQLAWLDRLARADAELAGEVVLAAAGALGHPDRGLQEAALKVVARHLDAAGPAVLPELRAAAEALDPAHRAAAEQLFGPGGADGAEGADGADPDGEYVELLPPVPPRAAVPGPVGSAAEAAEELAAALVDGGGVVAFERALDGLVRQAYLDRAALAEALEPVLRDGWRTGLYPLGEAVCGRISARRAEAVRTGREFLFRNRFTDAFEGPLAARLEEVLWRLVVRPVPLLLATPTEATGALDPAVLVERLARYAQAGVDPGPVDLAQALVRAGGCADEEVLAAAEALDPDVARWLRGGGLPRQDSQVVADGTPLYAAQTGVGPVDGLTADLAKLLGPVRMSGRAWYGWPSEATAHWAAMLPRHREEVAARLIERLADATEHDGRGAVRLLPLLAEADGPAGPALHLAVAYGLGASRREDRTAAVDALLVLAARGDLDAALLGRELGALVRGRAVKPNRAAEALGEAAATGAYGTVWAVLAAALPEVLADEPVRGAAELVALGVDCVRRCGARGGLPAVAALAGRSGSTKLLKEVRALHGLLG
ncbi:DUF6493 family protein [Kitasatospora sp. NPDC048365]|uniref:DUF7824 domain-containing protein n=1 Tax=Kitasatospora sp. NPDC048365 TaxID=3364050 RepID=UPI0037179823